MSLELARTYNFKKIINELNSRVQCIEFGERHRMIPTKKLCVYHHTLMNIDLTCDNNVGFFACNKGECQGKMRISRSSGTWFEDVKLGLPHIFYLMYSFSQNWSIHVAMHEDTEKDLDNKCLTATTVIDWYNRCREVVTVYHLECQEQMPKIGGPGKIVQIDETKFSVRKYGKGHYLDSHWVLGMIENGSDDLRVEVILDNRWPSEALIPLIKKHVTKGTTIHTDLWKAYNSLSDHGYIHKKVNICDPESPFSGPEGASTQRIASQWSVVKRFFYSKDCLHPEYFGDVIVEYLWRRQNKYKKRDAFLELVKAISNVYEI